MDRLGLTLAVSPFETPTSYLSRLAARNFSDRIDAFCKDVGVDLGAVSRGDSEAIRYLCRLAGLSEDAFRSSTITKTTTMKYLLGSEPMDTDTLNRGEVRVCPKCVLEQSEASTATWGIVHHLHWQIPIIERCTIHSERLITIGKKNNGPARLDVTVIIQKHWAQLQAASCQEEPDEFDRYLTDRIYGNLTGAWCDGMGIPALWRCAEALGITLLHGKQKRRSNLSRDELRKATLRGFHLLHGGKEQTVSALARFTAGEVRKRGHQPGPQYGELQRLLRRKSDYHPDLEPMRELMREYVIEKYPLEKGALVFGKPLDERRIHSMRSACREAKIRRELVEEMLLEKNIGYRDREGLFVLDRPLTVELVEDLKSEKRRFLSRDEAATFLGATETMFRELHREGVLQPLTGKGRWERKGFDAEFLAELLAKVFSGTTIHHVAPEGAHTLPCATRIVKCSVPEIMKLVLDGRLKPMGRLGEGFQLKKLLLWEAELREALPTRVRNGYTNTEVSRRLLVTNATLRRLREEGLLEYHRVRSSVSRVTNDLIVPASLANFERDYFSLGMLRQKDPEFSNLRVIDLERLKLKPVVEGDGLRRIYRWADLPEDPIEELEILRRAR
ncbi:TniQ family protein [Aliiroseovarius sp.]|uniref:TniQ family protein n=1 Tax=Aliiroseovarius sp. TaxID=1872442 RepID=UPI003BAD5941